MLLSTDDGIFSPKKSSGTTNELRSQMHAINMRMIDTKKRWANGYMHYNQVSREAYAHKFLVKPLRSGRQTTDGVSDEIGEATAQELTGPYHVSPIVKEKCKQYIQEFKNRDYACDIKTISYPQAKPFVSYLMSQVFQSNDFDTAKNAAFEDAVVKGTGVIRPRLYDQNKKGEVVSFRFDKRSKKRKLKTQDVEMQGKKGMTVEYVDIENVIIDPDCVDPKECFISTPMSDLELLDMFPFLESKLPIKYFGREKENAKSSINYEYLPFYKVGESFVDWYRRPELQLDITSMAVEKDGASPMAQEFFDPAQDALNSGSYLFESHSWADFNTAWENHYFGDEYNRLWRSVYQKYRLNEYYNWARDKYIVFVGDYVLYDGPMFEPHKECPLVPIYFDHKGGGGFFGNSVNDILYDVQIKASEQDTRNEQAKAVASVSFLEVNSDRLEEPNTVIKAEPLTTIYTRSPVETDNSAPAIQQIGIQNQTVAITEQDNLQTQAIVERLLPNTRALTAQMGKEGVQDVLYSPDLVVGTFLKMNALQFTNFAYKIFSLKLLEMQYLAAATGGYSMPFGDRVALVVEDTEENLAKTEKDVKEALQAQYDQQIEMIAKQIMLTPEFKDRAKNFRQTQMQAAQQGLQEAMQKKEQKPTAKNVTEFQNQVQERIEQGVVQMAKEQAMQQVPPPEDNNIYMSLELVSDILSVQKTFQFSFKESRQEMQARVIQFVQLLNQLPLAGMTLNYKTFMEDLAIANGYNPDIIAQEVPDADVLQTRGSTKHTTYFDFQKMPGPGSKMLDMLYGIPPEEQWNAENPILENLRFIANLEKEKEIAIQTSRVAESARANLANTALKGTTAQALERMKGAMNPEMQRQVIAEEGGGSNTNQVNNPNDNINQP